MQIFNVQWDKYGAPTFVVNFGECAVEGIEMRDLGHVAAVDADPDWCPRGGRLQRRRGPFGWFTQKKPFLSALATLERYYQAEAVVEEAISAFPEMEAWWEDKSEGPHIYVYRAG